jgi:hypothetical protein
MQKILGGLLTLGFIFGLKIGASYILAEVEVGASKTSAWTVEFRQQSITSCVNTAYPGVYEASMKEINNEGIAGEYSKGVSESYCGCIIKDIESAQIVPTKYNQLAGEEKLARDISSTVTGYLGTDDGKKKVAGCMKVAIDLTVKAMTAKN